jgi:BASS family bile acid:Na+ symporter
VLLAQLLLVAVNVIIILLVEADIEQKLLWEALLTCIIGPSASAAPVVVGKLGGNISTMTAYTLMSSLASALMIPVVFPMLESAVAGSPTFLEAFLIILQKVSLVLLLPLLLGWLVQHYLKGFCRWIASMPNLSFYLWAFSLSITTGITVKNIVHSTASLSLLLWIAGASLLLCFVQFFIGRAIGRKLGEEVNSGQALFQKNTALSIWVAYMYLNPVSSIGAGCYVLWQNIINSLELWQYRVKQQGVKKI